MDQPSLKYEGTSYIQKWAAAGAIFSSLVAVIMCAVWANGTDTGYLGGMNWTTHIFGWHPVLMTAGLIFFSISALVSYRLLPFTKEVTKTIHVVCHTCALVCTIVGFLAIYLAHSNVNFNTTGTYKSNFTTIHDFIGIAAILLYFQNYILGVVYFLMPKAVELKKKYMPSHVFLGIFSFICACVAALTGVMEKTSCSYDVTTPDYNSIAHYHLLNAACQLANGLGVVILLTLFLGVFAMMDIDFGHGSSDWRYSPVKDETSEL